MPLMPFYCQTNDFFQLIKTFNLLSYYIIVLCFFFDGSLSKVLALKGDSEKMNVTFR